MLYKIIVLCIYILALTGHGTEYMSDTIDQTLLVLKTAIPNIFISWPQAVDNGLLLCHLKAVFSFCTLVIIPVCGMCAKLCGRVSINFLNYVIMLSLKGLQTFGNHFQTSSNHIQSTIHATYKIPYQTINQKQRYKLISFL